MSNAGSKKRIVFVQTGDFRAAAGRIASGVGETFDAQQYSMAIVERLVADSAVAAVLCVTAEAPHDEILPSGVRSIGIDNIWMQKRPFDAVISQLDRLAPTHLVLRLPGLELLTWARAQKVRVLPSFADSFTPRRGLRGLRDRWRNHLLGKAINHSSIDRAGNHNVAAAEALAAIGVAPEKIVPWDWPRLLTPADYPAKAAGGAGPKRLICVGTVSEAKGVGDAIRALAADPEMGARATLDVVGAGDIEGMRALAASLGVADRVTFTGRIPLAEVAPRMHAADAVLVLSRHDYGEGMPGTIYLGLASRTPLVVSDHPMFMAYLRDKEDVLVAPERAPKVLAARLRALFEDDPLYERLSRNSEVAFGRITHPVLWGEFVERWLRDTPDDRAWLDAQALPRWRAAHQLTETRR